MNIGERDFNMGVVLVDDHFKPIEIPTDIGRFVLRDSPVTHSELVPCLDLIDEAVLDHSPPATIAKVKTGMVQCISPKTDINTVAGGKDYNLNLSFLEC